MRILFVCDGRSPIAINWISYFIERGDEVHITSTFEFQPEQKFASVNFIPVAFSQIKKETTNQESGVQKKGFLWNSALVNVRTTVRRLLAPATITSASNRLAQLIKKIQPEIVHAMRIPFEGIIASKALAQADLAPLVVSVWGNDFTLHARATSWMDKSTREVLVSTDGLHTDCRRDLHLANELGFRGDLLSLVIPGNGGIDTKLFYPTPERDDVGQMKVINPRGIRAYIRNDTFFKAIPHIISEIPDVKFICPGMSGESEAEKWVNRYKLSSHVTLLPKVTRKEMAGLFRESAVTVSPSTHDGTPNTLLEGMSCGSYPVAGDLESIREWILPGTNGSLIDPGDAEQLAGEVVIALGNAGLRRKAAEFNFSLIKEKAEYATSMKKAEAFYESVLEKENERFS
jgi:glycosyltransferase involved in cell wall biosynthesis